MKNSLSSKLVSLGAEPTVSWVIRPESLCQDRPRRRRRTGDAARITSPVLASAPTASWVVPLESLCQGSTSVPAARWVFRAETSPGTNLGADGELGVAARNALLGPATAPTASWVVRPAPLRQDQDSVPPASWVVPLESVCQGIHFGTGDKMGVSGRNTSPEPTSAPTVSWVIRPESLCQDRPRRRRRTGCCGPHHSARSWPRRRR